MPAAAAVVLAGVDDYGAADDAVRSDELDGAVLEGDGALAVLGHHDVAQRPDLALLVCRGSVILAWTGHSNNVQSDASMACIIIRDFIRSRCQRIEDKR